MKQWFIPLREMKVFNWVRVAFGALITIAAMVMKQYEMLIMGVPLLVAGFFGRRSCQGENCDL